MRTDVALGALIKRLASAAATLLPLLFAYCAVPLQTHAQQTLITIDAPASGQVVGGGATFSGWALDSQSTIAAMTLTVDGGSNVTAQVGVERDDVCNALGWQWPGWPYVG